MNEEGELYIAHQAGMADLDSTVAPAFAEAILSAYCSVASDVCSCKRNIEWTWAQEKRSDFVELMNDDIDVRFHQNYSAGTAVVRGTQPMFENQHYWEVKLTSPVYGTDIMIGVGTSDAEVSQVPDRFISLLGMDNRTWGLSYTGLFHHSGQTLDYSPGFSQGSVIGVHLDLWNGTLSFYKNRKHLGVATTGLTGKTLYAMASSTAARSGMRIIRTCSFPSSLQYLCCSKLREIIPDDKSVLDVLDIPPGLYIFLENNLGWMLDQRLLEDSITQCCCRKNRTNKSNSDITWFRQVIDEPENEMCSHHSDCYNSNGQYTLLGSMSYLFRNCNRFQTNSPEPHPYVRDSGFQLAFGDQGVQEYTSYSELQTEMSDESMEDHDNSVESSNKRLRFSYNYAMGLSDPDSD